MSIKRNSNIIWLRFLGVLLFCLFLYSCCSLFTVGVKRIHWNGMNIRQEGSISYPERISSFSQLYYRPEEATPIITIRMPDGKFLRSDKLSTATLNVYVRNGLAYEDGKDIIVKYRRGKMCIYLNDNGKMAMFIIDIHVLYSYEDISGMPPAISIPDSEKILEFPLQEKDMKELFGRPTKEEDYHFNT